MTDITLYEKDGQTRSCCVVLGSEDLWLLMRESILKEHLEIAPWRTTVALFGEANWMQRHQGM